MSFFYLIFFFNHYCLCSERMFKNQRNKTMYLRKTNDLMRNDHTEKNHMKNYLFFSFLIFFLLKTFKIFPLLINFSSLKRIEL